MRHRRTVFLLLAWVLFGTPAGAEVRVFPAGGIRIESAALLLSGQQGGEVPIGLLALPIPGEGGSARVLLRLRMDGPALLAGQGGGVLRVEVCLYAVGAGGGIQGSRLETVEIDLAGPRESIERSGLEFLGSLELRPGTYSLRVLVRNAETGKLAVRTLPLTIPETLELPDLPATGDHRVTARSASLGPLEPPPFPADSPAPPPPAASAASVPAPAPSVEGQEGRRLRREAQTAYRAALASLAAGREAEARAALSAFEEPLLTRREKPVPVETLVGIEMETARGLAAADPQALLPVLLLHQRLYSEAAAGSRLVASTQAREVCVRLLDLYREHAPEPAARFSLSFAADLLRTGVRGTGTRLLQSALAFDPADATALLYLAVEAEQRRATAEATGFLNRLLQAHADHAEARFRLARLSDGTAAEERLRDLTRSEPPRWILSLAYQELARRLLARRAWYDAENVLQEGLQRLPGDEKLTLLLATRLASQSARALLDGLGPEGDDGGGAARHRYNRLPEELLAPLRTDLDNQARERLGALAAALEKAP